METFRKFPKLKTFLCNFLESWVIFTDFILFYLMRSRNRNIVTRSKRQVCNQGKNNTMKVVKSKQFKQL